ncbi:hypothetical protein GCM10020000_82040 [Streptomyces olivoverticillatus]
MVRETWIVCWAVSTLETVLSREEDVLAEDPYSGVDDDVGRADVVGVLVDLADAAVAGLDLESGQVHARRAA